MWQTLKKDETLRSLGTNEKTGLSDEDVKQRQEKYDKNKLQEKKKGLIPFNTKGIKKKIRKWIQAFPEKFRQGEKERVLKDKEMKPLTQEYILDTYDKTGRYQQLEKRGTINDNLNEKA